MTHTMTNEKTHAGQDTEILEATEIRIDRYCGSYQYAEPVFMTVSNDRQLQAVKVIAQRQIQRDESKSSAKGSYWATLSVKGERYWNEMFNHRIK